MRKYFENKNYFFNKKQTCSWECRDAFKVGIPYTGQKRNPYLSAPSTNKREPTGYKGGGGSSGGGKGRVNCEQTPDGGLTFKQIGDRLGISRELARLICKRAMFKIRLHLSSMPSERT
jgi:hypothetical protein